MIHGNLLQKAHGFSANDMLKKALFAIVAVVVLVGIFVIVLPAVPPAPRVFEPTVWQRCDDHSLRFAMHDDLLHRYRLIGMSREDLTKLLGSPNSESATSMSWDMGVVGAYDNNAFRIQLKDNKAVSSSVFQR